jgi:hypothetical protein
MKYHPMRSPSTRPESRSRAIKPAIYVPDTIKMRMFTQILVRTRVPPLSILHDIRARLVQLDREQQVMQVRDGGGFVQTAFWKVRNPSVLGYVRMTVTKEKAPARQNASRGHLLGSNSGSN